MRLMKGIGNLMMKNKANNTLFLSTLSIFAQDLTVQKHYSG